MAIEKEITTERVVLASLLKNTSFLKEVIPFIKSEYFVDKAEQRVFELINDYVLKYNEAPNHAALQISITGDDKLSGKIEEIAKEVCHDVFSIEPPSNREWLLKTAEEWCKDRAIHNALNQSIDIQQGADKKYDKNMIPTLLTQALAICFDSRIGIDFYEDTDNRWDYYTNPEHKIAFGDLDIFNEITDGGIPKKTLNLLVAGVNVGKSMGLISLAAMYMRQGYDVLYISNEMSENEVFKRVDANLLGIAMKDIAGIGKEKFKSRVNMLKEKTRGRLIVKEYAPSQSHVGHYRHLMNELQLKKNFKPTVVLVDYLQITSAASVKRGSVNGFEYYKIVSEELRGFAKEWDVILWSAAQFNRGGMANSDAGMDDIAESKGIVDTADGVWGLMRTEELDALKQIMVKQLKSRYNEKSIRTRFTIGVDTSMQKFYNVEQTEADELIEKSKGKSSKSLKEKFAKMADEEDKPLNRFGNEGSKQKFGSFNF